VNKIELAIDAARNDDMGRVIKLLEEALAEQAEQEPVATDLMDMLRLIETIKYLRGIAERGLGREIRDDETIEQFVLGYVKQLEAAPVRTKDLTAQEKANIIYAADHRNPMAMIDAAIAAYKEKNK